MNNLIAALRTPGKTPQETAGGNLAAPA